MQKKSVFIIAITLFVLISIGSFIVFGTLNGSIPSAHGIVGNSAEVMQQNAKPTGTTQAVVDTEPKTQPCPMNGELYSKTQEAKWLTRRPLGIMIENHVQARPQSGISSADIVYEAVAEGGITRFLNIFYCQDAPYVGPVRSARIYFIHFLQEYGDNPLYAHVGGANTPGPADALGDINTLKWNLYNDLNQFSVPFPVYWRDYDRLPNVVTEHTMYSATAKLWDYAAKNRGLTNVDDKGNPWDKNFVKWSFKDDAALADRGTLNTVSFGFWNLFASDYAVTWHYVKDRNSFVRDNGGVPHLDKNTGKQLEAKNVVVMFADESPANDGYQGGHILYKNIGSGDAIVFQDGKAIKATWSKPTATDRTEFTDTNGKNIRFVRGKIFIEVLPIGNKVEY